MMNQKHDKINVFFICVALALTTLAVYWQVRHHEFISFDDTAYIVENNYVKAGLTREGLVWAFTKTHAYNWHPLTWLSHMLDCELYELKPGGHHFTNVLFHVANTLLLLLVLKRMTGSMYSSAFVAALFALHPLHVESVAWASERKDVLSGFFWILTMWAYVLYTERPNVARYLLILLLFALGLMSKQMLVTLPVVLLLLDYWPLGRLRLKEQIFYTPARSLPAVSVGRCVLEKVPLLILSVIASVTVYVVQQLTGTVKSFAEYPLIWRIGNALVAYAVYIGKMLWPTNLAIFYPHQFENLPTLQIIWSALLLVCITTAVLWKARQKPYLVVGWLWYLGTLVPVIGLVQVGLQAYADRYTYIPLIGLFISVAWGVPDIFARLRYQKEVLSLSAAILFLILGATTWHQVRYWRNNITLYRHAAGVVQNNCWAHNNLGIAYYYKGELDEASKHFEEALRIRPTYQNALSGMGAVLLAQGELDEAIKYLRSALQLKPDSHTMYVYLAHAHANLGTALAEKGSFDEAVEHLTEAVRLEPEYLGARIQMGHSLVKLGRIESAIGQYQKILQYKPNHIEALNALAWIRATTKNAELRDPVSAVEFAQKACELSNYENPGVLDTLAVAYAAAGNFPEAIKAAEQAIDLAEATGKTSLAEEIRPRLELYKSEQPYIQR